MQSTKFLFNKIKNRIRNNPVFSKCIYYPSSQDVQGAPYICVNLDNDRIFVCANMYISWDNRVIDFELTKEFLSEYTYHEVLKMHCSAYTYMVIYEIQEDSIN